MKSILVMKPGREGKAAAKAAAKGGMPVFFWPAFSFLSAKRSQADIEKLVQEARDGALLIVVSPAAVRCLSEIVPDFPDSTRFAAVGAPSAELIQKYWPNTKRAIFPKGTSLQSGSELLFDELKALGLPKKAIILRGQTGREFLFEELQKAGVDVRKEVIYRRIPFKASEEEKAQLEQTPPAAVYLTSSDSADILLENVCESMRESIKDAAVLTIHPRIAERLHELGFPRVSLIDSHDPNLIHELCRLARSSE